MPLATWPLWRDDPTSADDPDAFEAGGLLSYPPIDWWRRVNPAPKISAGLRPPPTPTRAAYWRNRSPRRLLRNDPLPGESKQGARDRVKNARSYFARMGSYQARERSNAAPGRAEWRVLVRGRVQQNTTSGPVDATAGVQSSPWQSVNRGASVSEGVILSTYYAVCRSCFTTGHRPTWADERGIPGSVLANVVREKVNYESASMVLTQPDATGKKRPRAAVTLEFRRP